MKSLLVLLFGVHLTHSQLLYRCNEFHSNDTCGRNLLPNSQWVIHRTYDLYEVSIASSWDTLLTVLYFNATDANSAIYEVNPVPVEPEIHRVCFQYEVIESDECEDPIHCATEIHLSLEDGLQVESTSRWKYWNYGWNLVMVQFDWNQTESLAELRFTLKGSILRPDQLTPYVKSPYLAIRYVYIFAGGCTPRIGPHRKCPTWPSLNQLSL